MKNEIISKLFEIVPTLVLGSLRAAFPIPIFSWKIPILKIFSEAAGEPILGDF